MPVERLVVSLAASARHVHCKHNTDDVSSQITTEGIGRSRTEEAPSKSLSSHWGATASSHERKRRVLPAPWEAPPAPLHAKGVETQRAARAKSAVLLGHVASQPSPHAPISSPALSRWLHPSSAASWRPSSDMSVERRDAPPYVQLWDKPRPRVTLLLLSVRQAVALRRRTNTQKFT